MTTKRLLNEDELNIVTGGTNSNDGRITRILKDNQFDTNDTAPTVAGVATGGKLSCPWK